MKYVLIICCCIFMSACAASYQKYTWSGGYKDQDLGDGKYLVEYYGNGTTSSQTVDMYWKQRADEVCPSGFKLLDEKDGKNTGSFTSGATTFSHPWKKATIECSN